VSKQSWANHILWASWCHSQTRPGIPPLPAPLPPHSLSSSSFPHLGPADQIAHSFTTQGPESRTIRPDPLYCKPSLCPPGGPEGPRVSGRESDLLRYDWLDLIDRI